MFNEEERQVYEIRMQALMDIESKIISAWDSGVKAGIEEGMKWQQLKIAKSLLGILDVETIALKTGLSVEEIVQLQ